MPSYTRSDCDDGRTIPIEEISLKNNSILEAIDEEIARLREVRALLVQNVVPASTKKSGRKAAKKTTKRTMSPEGRAKIAEGQRKRWAAAKKAAK